MTAAVSGDACRRLGLGASERGAWYCVCDFGEGAGCGGVVVVGELGFGVGAFWGFGELCVAVGGGAVGLDGVEGA